MLQVVTAQYFVWYLSFLPLVLPDLAAVRNKVGAGLMGACLLPCKRLQPSAKAWHAALRRHEPSCHVHAVAGLCMLCPGSVLPWAGSVLVATQLLPLPLLPTWCCVRAGLRKWPAHTEPQLLPC